MKTERKKVISFKGSLDFSEAHDFREMTISILHVMTSSEMLPSAELFCIFELTLNEVKYPKNFVPKVLLVLELVGRRAVKLAPPL